MSFLRSKVLFFPSILLVFGTFLPQSVAHAAVVPSCKHPYYPLRAGYEIAYRHPDRQFLPDVASFASKNYLMSMTDDTEVMKVTKVEKGMVRLTSVANWKETMRTEEGRITTAKEEKLDQTMYCKTEGLQGLGDINMTPEKMASLAVAKDLKDFLAECGHVKVVAYSGVYLPKTLTPKSEWRNSFHIVQAANPNATGCTFDLTATSTYKALGAHPIKVGKKSYTGIAVGVTTELRGESSKYGRIEQTFDPRVAYWVKGLGLVQISNADGTVRMSTDRVKP